MKCPSFLPSRERKGEKSWIQDLDFRTSGSRVWRESVLRPFKLSRLAERPHALVFHSWPNRGRWSRRENSMWKVTCRVVFSEFQNTRTRNITTSLFGRGTVTVYLKQGFRGGSGHAPPHPPVERAHQAVLALAAKALLQASHDHLRTILGRGLKPCGMWSLAEMATRMAYATVQCKKGSMMPETLPHSCSMPIFLSQQRETCSSLLPHSKP